MPIDGRNFERAIVSPSARRRGISRNSIIRYWRPTGLRTTQFTILANCQLLNRFYKLQLPYYVRIYADVKRKAVHHH